MKILSVMAFAACCFLGLTVHAQNVSPYPPANGGRSISIPETQWKFYDIHARGVDTNTRIDAADAFGNLTGGQHGTFFKFTAGFVSPVHSHTYDYYAVVIRGVMENYEVGVTPVKMGPGSYWYQRAKKAHTTVCLSKTGCEIFVVQSQKFDAQVPPKEE